MHRTVKSGDEGGIYALHFQVRANFSSLLFLKWLPYRFSNTIVHEMVALMSW